MTQPNIDFGLAPLKVEGSINIIIDEYDLVRNKHAINNGIDKLVMACAKSKFAPVLQFNHFGYGTQIIALRRKK